MSSLATIIKSLPPDAQKELQDFAEFLKQKYFIKKKITKLKLDWAGGLGKYKDKFEPVDLQHKITGWWGGVDVSG